MAARKKKPAPTRPPCPWCGGSKFTPSDDGRPVSQCNVKTCRRWSAD